MIFVFRVDASLQIGSGHVMRCLTLANALTAAGATCHFICREHKGNLIDKISACGHIVHRLVMNQSEVIVDNNLSLVNNSIDYQTWLGASWESDAKETTDILKAIRPDWLIVDHYSLDRRWEEIQKRLSLKLMVIDDLAAHSHECDLLLDQTYNRQADKYNKLVPKRSVVMAGSSYALLRPEFAQCREFSLQRRSKPKLDQLLITMGGVDLENVTGKILTAIKESRLSQACRVVVIMGEHAPWLEAVNKQAANMPWETDVLVNVSDMAKIMASSDLCIGAAGSTSWERCCLGLPALMVILAENQQNIAKALEEAGICRFIGEVNNENIQQRVVAELNTIITNIKLLENMSQLAAAVTDGNGVVRVISKLSADIAA